MDKKLKQGDLKQLISTHYFKYQEEEQAEHGVVIGKIEQGNEDCVFFSQQGNEDNVITGHTDV
eukprot:12461095-Ditylum_brightwellii.AAC.1